MALVPVATRNRVNPIPISTIEQLGAPYGTYGHVEICADPYCPECLGQRRGRVHKHHKRHHHHHHHHHRRHKKHRTDFWNRLFPRAESASSVVTMHSIELDERRPYYNSQVTERTVIPVDRTERQVVSRTRHFRDDDEIVREAWTNDRTTDDEVVCCRAYNGCRCPCWCCVILIILFVILIIVLIVLLATLL